MPEDTSNHNLNRPDKGQTDWGDDLNQNFSDLDTALQNISQDGETFSPERVLSKSKGFDSVVWKDGDTVKAVTPTSFYADADAATVIQNVLGTSFPRTPKQVYITRGRYNVTSTITLGDGQQLVGAGMGATTLQLPDNAGFNDGQGIVEFTNANDSTEYFAGVFRMEIDGNSDANSAGRGIVHNAEGTGAVKDFQLNRVMAFDCAEEGIYFGQKAWGYKLTNFIAEGNLGDGLYLNGEQWYIDNCFTAYNDRNGITCEGDHGEMHAVNARGNGRYGIEATSSAQRIRLVDSHAHQNDYIGMLVGGSDNAIAGCTGYNNGQVNPRPAFSINGHRNVVMGVVGMDDQSTATQRSGVEVIGDDNVVFCSANGNATQDLRVDGIDNWVAGYWGTQTDNGTRTRFRNSTFLSGAPTDSNYGSNDVGLELLDTSVSPPDEYRVLPDGTVSGPL